jgi:hypothetical protein
MSKPLRADEAERFQEHFRDLFDGKYIFSGEYERDDTGDRHPLYYVGYMLRRGTPSVKSYARAIDKAKVMSIIPFSER